MYSAVSRLESARLGPGQMQDWGGSVMEMAATPTGSAALPGPCYTLVILTTWPR